MINRQIGTIFKRVRAWRSALPPMGLIKGWTLVPVALGIIALYAFPAVTHLYRETSVLIRDLSLGSPVLASLLVALLLGRVGLLVATGAHLIMLALFIPMAGEAQPGQALAVIGTLVATQVAVSIIALLTERLRRDIVSLEQANRVLRNMALLDELTGLFNYRYLKMRLKEELELVDRTGRTTALLMLDIDHFKDYNDIHGHLAGDRALVELARILEETVRISDVVIRYGGEEFVIIAPEIVPEAAYRLGQRICQSVANHRFSGNDAFDTSLSISIGISVYPLWADTGRELILQADQALYHAKFNGGNRAELYPDAEDQTVNLRSDEEDAVVLAAVRTLLRVISARDGYTYSHSQRVMKYALSIGKRLDMKSEELRTLQWASLVHDLGKIQLSSNVLMKPEGLDDAEWALIQRHPDTSAQIIEPIIERMGAISDVVRAHHERLDGSGYPHGLTGESIPFAARILTVADAIDAMRAERPYRKSLDTQEIIKELEMFSGVQFDPVVVETAIAFLRDEELSLSELADG